MGDQSNDKPVIYATHHTTCSRRVIAAAIEKELDFAFKQIDMKGREHKSAEFLKLQPFGRVPVYQEGSFVLFESRAIMKHVAKSSGGTPLIPESAEAEATMEQAISVEYSYFFPAFMPIYHERHLKPTKGLGETNEAICSNKEKELAPVLDVLEKMLGNTSDEAYMAGNRFTLADLTFMPYFEMFDKVGLTSFLESRPNLQAWWKRCSARPAWVYAVSGKVMEKKI